jgi:glycerol-3-phosphate O-acyltransferase
MSHAAKPAPRSSRIRDLMTKPIRLPHWLAGKPRPNDPSIFAFNDDRDQVVFEVTRRILDECVADRMSLDVRLNETAHHEIERLEKQRDDEAREWLSFWRQVVRKLGKMSEAEQRETLRVVVEGMARDVAGNFDPRVYRFSQRILPGVIAGIMNPRVLAREALSAGRVGVGGLIRIDGYVRELHELVEHGTVILVPTHSSNLDSLVVGESLAREDLPPVVYGAGKNLFTNPIISFFMHNLGAYRVDRRIKAGLYKQVLKTYSGVMIERGYHSLFFPGGTRSRSGMVEHRLKLGLAGTGVGAFAHNAVTAHQRGLPARPVFFVPVTINYALVLEAESLAEDFLKEAGQARYIIEDDEFSQIDRWLAFLKRLTAYEGACVIRYGRALDPFGNLVDAQGRSLAPDGRIIDPVRYVSHRGVPVLDPVRDAAYTRELGRVIVEHYKRETVLMTTQFVAHLLFRKLVQDTPGTDLFGRMRRRGEITWAWEDYLRVFMDTRERLFELVRKGEVQVNVHLPTSSAERAFERATGTWDGYHTRTVARLDNEMQIVIEDPALLLYYQNRLVPYAEALAGSEDEMRAAREIAALGGVDQ